MRYSNAEGLFIIDTLALETEGEDSITSIRHPFDASVTTEVQLPPMRIDPVFYPVVRGGERVAGSPSLKASRDFARERFGLLPEKYKAFMDPPAYTVGLSEQLYRLRQELIEKNRHHG